MTGTRSLIPVTLGLVLLCSCVLRAPTPDGSAADGAADVTLGPTRTAAVPTLTATNSPTPIPSPAAVVVPDGWVPYTLASGKFTLYHPASWAVAVEEAGYAQFSLPKHVAAVVSVSEWDAFAPPGATPPESWDGEEFLDRWATGLASAFERSQLFEVVDQGVWEHGHGYFLEDTYRGTDEMAGLSVRDLRVTVVGPDEVPLLVQYSKVAQRGFEPRITASERDTVDLLAGSIQPQVESRIRFTPTPGPTLDPSSLKAEAREFDIWVWSLMSPAIEAERPLYPHLGLFSEIEPPSDYDLVLTQAQAAAEAWQTCASDLMLVETSVPVLQEARDEYVDIARRRALALQTLSAWARSREQSDFDEGREMFLQTYEMMVPTMAKVREATGLAPVE